MAINKNTCIKRIFHPPFLYCSSLFTYSEKIDASVETPKAFSAAFKVFLVLSFNASAFVINEGSPL